MDARPRLLLSTAPFFRHPLRRAFRHAAETGFEAVEVMVTADPATQDGRMIERLSREFGVEAAAIHAPFLLITRRVMGTEPVEKIYRSVQVARQAGIPLLVVHPPYRWQRRYRRWVRHSLEDFSGRTGVTIAVENMFPVKLRGDRGLRFHVSQDFEDLDAFPHLVLDTSHLAVSGIDLLEAYRRYRGKIVHYHLSNNAGKGWDSHLSVDEGILPIGDLLERVAADRQGGSIALELDLRRWMDDDRALNEVLVRNREFCEHRLRVSA